jgi:hypothetical protein
MTFEARGVCQPLATVTAAGNHQDELWEAAWHSLRIG